jgi:hypothetical protein
MSPANKIGEEPEFTQKLLNAWHSFDKYALLGLLVISPVHNLSRALDLSPIKRQRNKLEAKSH